MKRSVGRVPRAFASVLACALALAAGCGLDDPGPCLFEVLYQVEGDLFTPLSGGFQTLTRSGRSDGPTGWRPDLEPRAKSRVSVRGYGGNAQLLWNDVVVQERSFDRGFSERSETLVLEHTDPDDGTRVELHLYARPACGHFPAEPLTRAEVAEAEESTR
jgi:hypothetical protein